MAGSRLRTLLCYVHYSEHLSYFDDWRDAFRSSPALRVVDANLATPLGRHRVRRRARDVDLVVLLHSAIGDSLEEVRRCAGDLARRRAPMLAFVGNEVSLPTQPIAAKLEMLGELGADFIGTQLLLEAGEYLYADVPDARVIALPHALNAEAFRPIVPSPRRVIDIGFRGARYIAQIGDDDRNRLIDGFLDPRVSRRLRVDIETEVIPDRRGWSEFLNRCRGTIGVESGSSFLTRDDRILELLPAPPEPPSPRRAREAVTRHLPRWMKEPFRPRSARRPLPAADRTASGSSAVPLPESPVYGKCISSRHFDAIGTETCQIMFPGRYNDLLEPDRHYLKLERDFANLDDVLERFADEAYREHLVAETREWALDSQTYRHRVDHAIELVSGS